jgi:hypothetical protein
MIVFGQPKHDSFSSGSYQPLAAYGYIMELVNYNLFASDTLA